MQKLGIRNWLFDELNTRHYNHVILQWRWTKTLKGQSVNFFISDSCLFNLHSLFMLVIFSKLHVYTFIYFACFLFLFFYHSWIFVSPDHFLLLLSIFIQRQQNLRAYCCDFSFIIFVSSDDLYLYNFFIFKIFIYFA